MTSPVPPFSFSSCAPAITASIRSTGKGRLSVTFGTGSRARILEEELIRFNHKLLQGVIILDGDYRQTEKYAGEKSFFYFDPPYKPVNEAGACTSYMPDDFDDDCQIELAGFCKDLGEKGSK